jgi:hypothetical protein
MHFCNLLKIYDEMEEIFIIGVNNEPFDIRAMDMTAENTQYEVCKNE